MFCPICKAEYRPGFSRCVDCDVDLVPNLADAARLALSVETPAPEKYGALLWRGSDPHFYLGLLGSLATPKVPCLGRAAKPPIPGPLPEPSDASPESPEFAVWVPPEKLGFARWILGSSQAKYEEEQQKEDSSKEGADLETAPGTVGICPLCFAEFETASNYCPNCGVPLRLAQRGSLEENPAKQLCDIAHPKFLADLRAELRKVGIPFNNGTYLDREIITGRFYIPSHEILVLSSDFDRATKVMSQVLQHWELEPKAGFGMGQEPFQTYWPLRAEESRWLPEDLSAGVWEGESLALMSLIAMALREHEIAYRIEANEPGFARVFTHPEDQARALGIVGEIVEGPSAE